MRFPHLGVQGVQEPVLQFLWHVIIAQCRVAECFLVRLKKPHSRRSVLNASLILGCGRIKCASDIVQQQRCGLFTRDPAWYGLCHAPVVLTLRG